MRAPLLGPSGALAVRTGRSAALAAASPSPDHSTVSPWISGDHRPYDVGSRPVCRPPENGSIDWNLGPGNSAIDGAFICLGEMNRISLMSFGFCVEETQRHTGNPRVGTGRQSVARPWLRAEFRGGGLSQPSARRSSSLWAVFAPANGYGRSVQDLVDRRLGLLGAIGPNP